MNERKEYSDEKDLIEACIQGKRLAQEKLFRKYYPYMLSICLRYSVDRDEAKEILQEGFIKVFNNIQTFKFEGSFRGWIKRIMVNTAIDKFRKRSSEPFTSDVDNHQGIEVKEDILSQLTNEEIINCINKLPVGYRTIFNMYVIEGYSHKEIADMLGINEGTSKSQLFKAKNHLKEIIGKLYL